jgi:HD-GYP domain-containing protein (c-di-GMP phosphodiesterase class II)
VATEIEEHQVGTHQLKLGMYVSRLDRPWLGTPFPLQGFLVDSIEKIELVRKLCDDVYIDVHKSVAGTEKHLYKPKPVYTAPIGPRIKTQYVDREVAEEMPRARDAHAGAEAMASRLLDDVRAGRDVSAAAVKDVVLPIVDSIVRSPDAFFWIDCLKRRDATAYSHALTCSALAAAFGRHMGFPEPTLATLATGAFLLDFGKALLPTDLLDHDRPLDHDQQRAMRRHVEYSVDVIARMGIRDKHIDQMVRTHHERYDGSGYPDRLRNTQIPMFGRFAGLIDSFDAMTSPRPHRRPFSRHEALQQLYRAGDVLYQREVVEQLIQCIGVYPIGTLVELNTGEVGLVLAQNRARHLRPRVLLLTSPDKQLMKDFPELDLMHQAEGSTGIQIAHVLEPNAYGLDPAELFL